MSLCAAKAWKHDILLSVPILINKFCVVFSFNCYHCYMYVHSRTGVILNLSHIPKKKNMTKPLKRNLFLTGSISDNSLRFIAVHQLVTSWEDKYTTINLFESVNSIQQCCCWCRFFLSTGCQHLVVVWSTLPWQPVSIHESTTCCGLGWHDGRGVLFLSAAAAMRCVTETVWPQVDYRRIWDL